MNDNQNVDRAIGLLIRKHRESRGYTQEEFSFQCGISRAYYGRIERGEYHVTLFLCYKISQFLGIRMNDLFEDFPD